MPAMSHMDRVARWFGYRLRDFLAPAEDPRQRYPEGGQREREVLERVRRALANLSDARRDLEAKASALRHRLPTMEASARHALAAGQEDLARLALERRQTAAVELGRLGQQAADIQRHEGRLRVIVQRLLARVEALETHQDVLAARFSTAQVRAGLADALVGAASATPEAEWTLLSAEETTEEVEARAEAIDRLLTFTELAASPPVDLLGTGTADEEDRAVVERQLDTLRREFGAGTLDAG